MVEVPEEVKAVFKKQQMIPMATADASCKPNVVLMGMWWWADEETLVVVDNYLNKTRRNIEENPLVALVGWDREARKSFQIKCRAEIRTSGSLYQEGRRRAQNRVRPLPGKAVVVLNVEEIYQAAAGENAGKKLR